MAERTDEISNDKYAYANKDIIVFLQYADLEKYKDVFETSGLTKVDHLKDVQEGDMYKFGLTEFEVRRFFRRKQEYFNQRAGTTSNVEDTIPSTSNSEKESQRSLNPLKPYLSPPQWKVPALGYVPNATTERACFMNSLLPDFYNSKFKHCRNAKDFCIQFHSTGRQMYQVKQRIDNLGKNIDSVLNTKNPAAAGTLLEEDYTVIPSDSIRIRQNIERVQKITNQLEQVLHEIKEKDGKLFTVSGKLKSGEDCSHKEFEKYIGQVYHLRTQAGSIEGKLESLQEKSKETIKEHLSFCLDDEDQGTESFSDSINRRNSEDVSTDDSDGDSEDIDGFEEN
ncbi:uncharacterized protein LOC114534779 [Dendronephthya gigantea]|uniref:uncharacterized protein LOC114534779 n=1 Tax=Dendronephthya gigantea TaxID=151771 RepID=UPI00106DC3FA|nr:uncharacterized protein LOC114534779 [Dendronephthya gigantea]